MINLNQLATLVKSLIRELRDSLFSVEVTNLPETQKVEVINPTEAQETVEVSNLIDHRPELKEIVNAIEAKVQKFDDSAQKKDIVKALKDLKTKPVKDLTPQVIKEITKSVKLLEKIAKAKPDYSDIVKEIKTLSDSIVDPLEKYARYDEIKTRLNDKQLQELKDALGKSTASLTQAGSGILKNQNGPITPTNGAQVTVYGQDGIPLFIDSATEAMPTLEYAHHEIHSGSHYFVKGWMDLTNAQVFDFLATTPDTLKWAHMVVAFSAESEAHITIYEGTTTSADGTAVTAVNRDRNSTNTAGLVITHTPTVTNVGTQIASYKMGSMQKAGGEVRGNNELILKQNTKYLIRVTNDTALNNWFDYLADWYEHQNKN